MSQGELRKKNKEIVVRKALGCFIEQGIDKTKVSEIAEKSGLTERSIFRYFDTKADLVLAASYLYWNLVLEYIDQQLPAEDREEMTGLEEIRHLLICYSNLYYDDPKGLRFTLDAELTLDSAGKKMEHKNQPPEPYESSNGQVARAIRKGLADGSVSPNVDVRELYYNSYDTILGIMQRLSIGGTPSGSELDYKKRMESISDMYVRAFAGYDKQ